MHSHSSESLKEAGLRVTGPRRAVLELFEKLNNRHLSAEQVYQALAELGDPQSLATIYRVLGQFEAAGLLVRHHVEGGRSLFELSRYGDHNHLICRQCDKMFCFSDPGMDQRQHEIAAEHGFELHSYVLYTYVDCRKSNCPNRHKRAKRGGGATR